MKTIFTYLFLSSVFIASAQNTFKTRLFPAGASGTYYDVHLSQATQLNDGSIVSIGYISGDGDSIWLVKTSAAGTVLASQRISTDAYDEGISVVKTSDGGFTVAGTINFHTTLLKFKADLSLQWKQFYDFSSSNDGSRVQKMIQTTDGGYLLAGYVVRTSSGYTGNLIKTDSLGVIQFQKRYFDYGQNFISDITPTTDGNYAILIKSNEDAIGTYANFVGKIKPDGTLLWLQQFSDASSDRILQFYAITGITDGGVIATGYSENAGAGDGMLLVKFDTNGDLTWSKILKGSNSGSIAFTVLEDKDGGYLFGGFRDNFNVIFPYVIKTSSAGALLWKKRFDPDAEKFTRFTNLMATSDGGFVATGDGYYSRTGNNYVPDGIVYKFNSSFESCGDTAVSPGGSLSDFAASLQTPVLSEAGTALIAVANDFTVTDIEDAVDNTCNVLPLQLLSFNATLQNKSVAVQWTTANEINTSYFTVERSKDAASFSALQQVAAKGNNAGVQSYNTTDLQPLPGTSYYRLQEVDKDGKITYSSVVPVTMLNNGVVIISPNPVRDVIRVVIQSTANANITCQLIDMKGAVLATQKTSVASGRNEILIPAASLAKGVYILKVIENNTTQSLRFVKE